MIGDGATDASGVARLTYKGGISRWLTPSQGHAIAYQAEFLLWERHEGIAYCESRATAQLTCTDGACTAAPIGQ